MTRSHQTSKPPIWEGRILSEPLRGGTPFSVEGEWGVLYNPQGYRLPQAARLTPRNAMLSVLTRNRSQDVLRLIDSIERSFPFREAPRVAHVNNSTDGTEDAIRHTFPNWKVIVYHNSQHKEASAGILWIRRQAPYLLPGAPSAYDVNTGYVSPNSIAWLRNQTFRACPTPWLISFDDDCEVLPDWFSYYETMQHATNASAVINNWAFLALHKSVVRRLGWYDERYVSNHGFEDTDYALRLNRSSIPWVLGFNAEHDWRTAEEGNPRGSMTGNDRFIHRSAILRDGFSARLGKKGEGGSSLQPFVNAHWHHLKWRATSDERTGVIDRPPFKGTYFRCTVPGEPTWYPFTELRKEEALSRLRSLELRRETSAIHAPAPLTGILPPASIVLTNRDTLPYLSLALRSLKKHFTIPDHELVLFDDASAQRDVEWLRTHQHEYGYELYLQRGDDRVGIVHAYDFAVKVARRDVVFIIHSDMYFSPDADRELLRRIEPGVVLSATRVEPPIHRGQEQAKVIRDFGRDADSFDEAGFIRFAESFSIQNKERTTSGLFAPFLLFRDDYRRLGGHDPAFAPQSLEDSDFFNRMVLAGYRTLQCWSSLCYHFTSRGSRFREGIGRDSSEWTRSHWKNRRNFSRKWGRALPSVDEYSTPKVERKYTIGLALRAPTTFSKEIFYRLLAQVEPFTSMIDIDSSGNTNEAESVVRSYIEQESNSTPLLSPRKITLGDRSSLDTCDVVVTVALETLANTGPQDLLTLPGRLDELQSTGTIIHGSLLVEVRRLDRCHELENLLVRDPETFNPELPRHARIEHVPLRRGR